MLPVVTLPIFIFDSSMSFVFSFFILSGRNHFLGSILTWSFMMMLFTMIPFRLHQHLLVCAPCGVRLWSTNIKERERDTSASLDREAVALSPVNVMMHTPIYSLNPRDTYNGNRK